MEYFDYQVVDEDSGKILRPNGLPIVLMSIAAMNVIRAQGRLNEDSNNAKAVDYAMMTRRIIEGILEGEHFAKQKDIVERVLAKVLDAIDKAVIDSKASDDRGNLIGAINDFYQSATSTLLDNLEVIKDEYKPISKTDSTMQHEGCIKITHDGNEWLFRVTDLAPDDRDYDVEINGMKFTNISETKNISSDARWHAFLFSSMALQMIHGMQAAQRVNSMLGNPDIVRKSKEIAKVMGGDFEDYLHSVSEFDTAIKRGLASGEIVEDDINIEYMNDYTIKRNPNITKEEVEGILALFKNKPIYH